MNWIPVSERLPTVPGVVSEPIVVAAREFDSPWCVAIARCWISTDAPLLPKFYLDQASYGLNYLAQIAQEVRYWMPLEFPSDCILTAPAD